MLTAIDIAKQFEGCAERQPDGTLKAYWDPLGKCWTIGWGTTGPEIVEGLVWTQAQADEALQARLNEAQAELLQFSPGPLAPGAEAALTDFIYNEGAGRYEHSTLRTYVDQQLWTAVKLAILQWDIGGGKVEPGLLRRRKAEADLISVSL